MGVQSDGGIGYLDMEHGEWRMKGRLVKER
jgi:hypothetical protein